MSENEKMMRFVLNVVKRTEDQTKQNEVTEDDYKRLDTLRTDTTGSKAASKFS